MRLFQNRRYLFLLIFILSIVIVFHLTKSSSLPRIKPQSNEVQLYLTKLFNPSISLNELKYSWKKLIELWKDVLMKYLHDGCDLCHAKDHRCFNSININRYVNLINESFYPWKNGSKKVIGMGFYYKFDLLFLRSLNNSILFNDKSICDYFHMFQLLIHVQMIFHQNQMEYFLTKGTLIGSLRHHDLIPWDTDIDIFIPHSSIHKLTNSIKRLQISPQDDPKNFNPKPNPINSGIYREDLVVYHFRNTYRVASYKIFSVCSTRVNRTFYNWPKIDVFPYYQSRTHVFAYPRHQHNLGTMGYLSKDDLYPLHLRPLGPLLLPSPQNLRQSIKAMVRLGRSNIFDVCEGNTFLHRQNRGSTETWRVPCRVLSSSYPFVRSHRHSSTQICTEMLIFNHTVEQILSLYQYKCNEHLPRTLE